MTTTGIDIGLLNTLTDLMIRERIRQGEYTVGVVCKSCAKGFDRTGDFALPNAYVVVGHVNPCPSCKSVDEIHRNDGSVCGGPVPPDDWGWSETAKSCTVIGQYEDADLPCIGCGTTKRGYREKALLIPHDSMDHALARLIG